jgi:glyoxylase-like metal-dependent hydrolase (beta-lactamase superfamily II)
VIDPGPDVPEHVRALKTVIDGAERAMILLTHGHADHAGAAAPLAAATGAEVWGPGEVSAVGYPLADGASVETDAGHLVAVATPGHAREHLCFHWPERRALFAGDTLLGVGDTTWVAEYPGCVADYLDSLERLRGLELDVIYPAHGPPLSEPADALDRFEAHRRLRIRQVRDVLLARPDADLEDLLEAVYGDSVSPRMRGAARRSLGALLEHARAVPD